MQNPILGPLARPEADMMNRTLDQFQSRIRSVEGSASLQKKEDLKKVAQDFESLFVAYLLKVMRETIEESGDGAQAGLGKSIYTELFDEEISKTIAKQSTLGISDMLMKRLSAAAPVAVDPSSKSSIEHPQAQPQNPVPAAARSPEPPPELDSEIPDIHLPVRAPISSSFGIRKDPFTRQLRFHKGMDLAAPRGTDVRAALEGEVVFAGFKQGYGNTVIIQHAGGLETTYAHLGSTSVKKGDSIAAEQVLGTVGNTGHSTGPHLHFEVARWGEQIDPRNALSD
jgi:murein DD-endopeptidase MepM/ murein hydrolase activator NlpD